MGRRGVQDGVATAGPWFDHWLETCGGLSALPASHPMVDAVIEEVDGRMIRVGSRWLADFASCNYLGFDLDRQIIEAVPAYLDTWGTHPSWSRLLGSPALYEQIEQRLVGLLSSEDALVLPTITHIHLSVIPALAASGTIFIDARAHKTIYDGCQIARARGAAVNVGRLLFDRGIYVTLAGFPLVPKADVGFRIQLTAANTDAEVEALCAVLAELASLGELREVGASYEAQAAA